MNYGFSKYLLLRDEIDEKCKSLWRIHAKHMKCKSGCASCCQSFKVLPVEFDYIQQQLNGRKIETNPSPGPKECKFLIDNKCSIYEFRPIICRTHGYPLVRLNEELEEYEVSYCHLNFTTFKLEEFNATNVYFEDTFNSKLYAINKEYLEKHPDTSYSQGELVPLNNLKVNQ